MSGSDSIVGKKLRIIRELDMIDAESYEKEMHGFERISSSADNTRTLKQ